MLTLNQVVKRIKTIALSQAQVRNFYFGSVTDFLNDKTTKYAAIFLQDEPGNISPVSNALTFNFKLYALDLENTSEDTQANTLDVQSDMLSVCADFIAIANDSSYDDWDLNVSANYVLVRESFDDMVAGVILDVQVSIPFNSDVCAAPRNVAAIVSWDYFSDDPSGILDELAFRNSMDYIFNTDSLFIQFQPQADQNYLVVRLPASENEFLFWYNTTFNQGEIPDFVYHSIETIGAYQYICTRRIANLDPATQIVKYSKIPNNATA